jgi:hypothetical protein
VGGVGLQVFDLVRVVYNDSGIIGEMLQLELIFLTWDFGDTKKSYIEARAL